LASNEKPRDPYEIFRQDIKHLKNHKKLTYFIVVFIPLIGSVVMIPFIFRSYSKRKIDSYLGSFTDLNLALGIFALTIGLTALLLAWGIVTGYVWRWLGKRITKYLFFTPLRIIKEGDSTKTFMGSISKLLYGKGIENKFLLYEAPDIDHSGPIVMTKAITKIIKIFTAMFIIVLNALKLSIDDQSIDDWLLSDIAKYINKLEFLSNVELAEFLQIVLLLVLSFMISLSILAVYLPLILISDDARLLRVMENGKVIQASSGPRNLLDNVFGLTTIFSGFSLIRSELELETDFRLILEIFAFAILLVIIIIGSIPIIFPAVTIYYQVHDEIVNSLRISLVDAGFPIAKSGPINLSNEETTMLRASIPQENRWFE